MRVTVQDKQVREQEITLVLDEEEFAMLDVLCYRHLGGNANVRKRIEESFRSVRAKLDDSVTDKIGALKDAPDIGWNSEKVAAAFKRDAE
jgi:hypothetical protein